MSIIAEACVAALPYSRIRSRQLCNGFPQCGGVEPKACAKQRGPGRAATAGHACSHHDGQEGAQINPCLAARCILVDIRTEHQRHHGVDLHESRGAFSCVNLARRMASSASPCGQQTGRDGKRCAAPACLCASRFVWITIASVLRTMFRFARQSLIAHDLLQLDRQRAA